MKRSVIEMKKIILTSLMLSVLVSFGNHKNPFENKNFKYAFENVGTIFGDDYRCKFISKQILLKSYHTDNGNIDMIKSFEDSLKTYGRIIQLEADFDKIEDPVEVTTVYYSRYCKIPNQEWLDKINSPALNKYMTNIEMLRNRK